MYVARPPMWPRGRNASAVDVREAPDRTELNRGRRLVTASLATAVLAIGAVTIAVSPVAAVDSTYYAYANGGAVSPTSCPDTATPATAGCSLAQALSLVASESSAAGDTVLLATPGVVGDASTHYVGNFTVSPSGTTTTSPVTIEAAPGIASPILDGNSGSETGCSTAACNGSILTVNPSGWTYVSVSGLTFLDGDAAGYNTGHGGAIYLNNQSSMSVVDSTFLDNSANRGGAIDVGDGGSGDLTVSGSTFDGNSGADGGAIDVADETDGVANFAVSDSTFVDNSATFGGAIDTGDNSASSTVSIIASTFSGNTASSNGATVDAGDGGGTADVTTAADIFAGSCTFGSGQWTDEGYSVGSDSSCEGEAPAATDVTDADVASQLSPLSLYRGTTDTELPSLGSPAVNLIPSGTSVGSSGVGVGAPSTSLCPTTDQSGYVTAAGYACDAGAAQTDVSVTVTGSQAVGSTSPDFAWSAALPPGLSTNGAVTCTTLAGPTEINSSLLAGDYTIDGSSCTGLSLSGANAGYFAIVYLGGSFVVGVPMQLVYTTTAASEGIALPLLGSVDVTVDWGDGTALQVDTVAGGLSHVFASAGTYTVSIIGSLSQFGDAFHTMTGAQYLTQVISFGDLGLTSLSGAFTGASSLTSVPATLPPTVTDLSYTFDSAGSFNGDIGTWNVGNVTNLYLTFEDDGAFNQDLSSWNTSDVSTMYGTFYGTHFNGDIDDWNTSNVSQMSAMFYGDSSFNQDISSWNVSNVYWMDSVFSYASSFDQNISTWNVSGAGNTSWMFQYDSAFNQDLGSWDIANDNSMSHMFDGSGMSTENYDATLVGWADQPVLPSVTLGASGVQYSCAGALARQQLITTDGWTILDGGPVGTCSTTLALTNPLGVTYGAGPATITATASIPGTVAFTADGGSIGCDSVATTATTPYVATCSWTPSAAGTFDLGATLSPTDTTDFGSTVATPAPDDVVVAPAATMTHMTAGASVVYGAEGSEKFSVTVTSTAGTPPGSVAVRTGSTLLCTAPLTAGVGSCSLTPTQLAGGIYSVIATYQPSSSNYAASSSAPANVDVTSIATTTTLQVTTPVSYGGEEDAIMRVHVAAATPPNGSATLRSGSQILCTATIVGGAGTCSPSASALGVGTFSIIATYVPGSASDRGSVSSAEALEVVKATTAETPSIAIVSGSGSLRIVRLSAKLLSTVSGDPLNGLSLHFTLGSTTSPACSANTDSVGVASCTISVSATALRTEKYFDSAFAGTSLYLASSAEGAIP